MSTRPWLCTLFVAMQLCLSSLSFAEEPLLEVPVPMPVPMPVPVPVQVPAPPPLPAPLLMPPPPSPQLLIPLSAPALRPTLPSRSGPIALVVLGTMTQFAGVSMLVPAVWHGAILHDNRLPLAPIGGTGAALVIVGNIAELLGWKLLGQANRERARMVGSVLASLDDR